MYLGVATTAFSLQLSPLQQLYPGLLEQGWLARSQVCRYLFAHILQASKYFRRLSFLFLLIVLPDIKG
ncbi:MAG: hypothetical protein CL798_08525 [Chromatiales bacterium]|jgi:hypothetical protein|nr:hypothetical protein [Chromatiales bacterium]